MKDKHNIFEDNPQGTGIILGLLACTGIEIYERYSDDIARKAIEMYNKIQPTIQPYMDSLSNIDPYHVQLAASAISVSILSAILVKLRKENKSEQKVNREFVKCNFATRNMNYAYREIGDLTHANYAYKDISTSLVDNSIKVKKLK